MKPQQINSETYKLRYSIVFFQNEEIFVQLDELDETTDAWIRTYLKVLINTNVSVV